MNLFLYFYFINSKRVNRKKCGLYFCLRMCEMRGIGVFRGLDKNFQKINFPTLKSDKYCHPDGVCRALRARQAEWRTSRSGCAPFFSRFLRKEVGILTFEVEIPIKAWILNFHVVISMTSL